MVDAQKIQKNSGLCSVELEYNTSSTDTTGYPHEGMDFSCSNREIKTDPDVSPRIFSIAEGKIVFIMDGCKAFTPDTPESGLIKKCGDGWGNHLVVDHGNGYFSRYVHFQKGFSSKHAHYIGKAVIPGKTVLGDMGRSGWVNNVHLHLEIGTYMKDLTGRCMPFKFDKVYNPRQIGQFTSEPFIK